MSTPDHDRKPAPQKSAQETQIQPAPAQGMPRLNGRVFTAQQILQLQRLAGNRATQQILASSAAALQRQASSVRDHRITIATKIDDMLGHAYVILERPLGNDVYIRETWGFYPTVFDMGAMLGSGEGVPGRVVHPDPHNAVTPTTTYEGMATAEGYQRAVTWARRQAGRSYHLRNYNCANFANDMFTMATGEPAPNSPSFLQTPRGTANATVLVNFGRYLQSLF